MRTCPLCRAEYSDEIQVCERDQTPLAPTAETKGGKPLSMVMAVVGVVCALIGGRYIYEYQVIRPRMLEAQAIACRSNLKAIEGAKAIWMLENRKTDRDEPPASELFGPGKMLANPPQCFGGGTYRIGICGELPSCSVHSR